ncbi:MAG: biotin/lipoyl-containing protein [Euryarchaeota archaeon]|tara:strand:- start:650 stop:1057 length:408 start_codon:yes stop_codon:yes gene_type:complete
MKNRKVKVDGEEYEVELEKQEGVWNVTIEGKSFRIEIEGGSVGDMAGNKRKKKGRGKKSGTISSTIPGKIVSIAVEEGDIVAEGDVVMILEAMKMQNEIQAPLSGNVTAVNCKPGDSIEANSPLIVIQPEEKKTE